MFIAVVEGPAALAGPQSGLGTILLWLDPFRAPSVVLDPLAAYPTDRHPTAQALGPTLAMTWRRTPALALDRLPCAGLESSRNIFIAAAETPGTTEEQVKTVVRPPRRIWETPILWREICTRAYGRKMILIKVAYALLAAAIWWGLCPAGTRGGLILGVISYSGFAFVAVGAHQPAPRQRPGGDVADERAGRADPRAAPRHRDLGQGVHLRQARRGPL